MRILVFTIAAAACAAPPDLGATDQATMLENGVDWNGVDWNGVDWNGIDWNGVDWNGVDWNGVDWNGIDDANLDWAQLDWTGAPWTGVPWSTLTWSGLDRTTVDWNRVDWRGLDWNAADWALAGGGLADPGLIDWTEVEIRDVWRTPGAPLGVHADARPLFVFVRAAYEGVEFPLAIPGPGALRLLATAPDRAAVLYFLRKTWQIAYGPGFYMFAGFAPTPPDTVAEIPLVTEGHFGLAPSLAGLGPYVEPQVRAWTSMVGNLLNNQPLRISLRAADVEALAASYTEVRQYYALDIRAAIGRLMPPPWEPEAAPLVVLLRSRAHMARSQLHLRGACPLDGQRVKSCAGGQVWVVDLEQPGPDFGCTGVIDDLGPHHGSVAGGCWVDLAADGVHVTQAADEIPTIASFVYVGLPQPPEP